MNSLGTAKLLWAPRPYARYRGHGCIIQLNEQKKSEEKPILTNKEQ